MHVIKVGGRELSSGPELERLVAFVKSSLRSGTPVVVVHGGGDEVTDRAQALGLSVEWHRGQRVTSPAMLDVVIEVLAGRVNARLVAAFEASGIPAVGLAGASAGMLSVEPDGDPPGSLGSVGRPVGVNGRILRTLLDEGWTPVVAPIGVGPGHALFNVNADFAAAAIAAALHAELLLVTDVDGVLSPRGVRYDRLSLPELRRCLADGTARGGMLPKLEAAQRGLLAGARAAWIGSAEGLDPTSSVPVGGTWLGRGPAPARLTPSLHGST
jgi:acetylglutamate kinase